MDKDTLDWRVKMYLGAIALSQNQDSAAIHNFEQVTKMASWNVQAWIRLGGLYFDNQKYHESVKVMQEAIKSFPEDFTVNLILGLALDQSDKHEDATAYLKKAVDLNPNDITALSAYGYNLNEIKKPKEAIEYLKKALVIKPDDVNLLGTLGLIYNAQKMYTECDSVYEKALELDSSNALVNNNYAYSLSVRGKDLNRALNMVNLALKADSNNSSYLDTKGWIFYKMKNYSEAKEYINKAIKSGGERAEILEHLGDVEFMMGKKETAQELWKKAYNLDSTNNELKLKIEKGEI